jgi:hypothetical protein
MVNWTDAEKILAGKFTDDEVIVKLDEYYDHPYLPEARKSLARSKSFDPRNKKDEFEYDFMAVKIVLAEEILIERRLRKK